MDMAMDMDIRMYITGNDMETLKTQLLTNDRQCTSCQPSTNDQALTNGQPVFGKPVLEHRFWKTVF